MERDSLATLPNLISLSRLVLGALFVLLRGSTERVLILAIAGATDFLDGYFARTRGGASKLGALVDPIADRIFLLTAVSALLFEGAIEGWQFAILLLRDIMTVVGFVTARIIPWLRTVAFKSRFPGKVVTVMQLATLVFVLVAPAWINIAIALLAVASVYSVGDYTLALWRARARA
jgi:CDP-diacylglycerol--glycerol-3-phosphate 3-phosphatidyltransferase/cardiolipin synthase